MFEFSVGKKKAEILSNIDTVNKIHGITKLPKDWIKVKINEDEYTTFTNTKGKHFQVRKLK